MTSYKPFSDHRFPPVPVKDLSGSQKEHHDDMIDTASRMFGASGDIFTYQDSQTGALVGPFAPFLHQPPEIAHHFIQLAATLSTIPGLPPAAREVAILAVGAHFNAGFELYSHEHVAIRGPAKLSKDQVDALKAGGRPPTERERGGDGGAAKPVDEENLQIAWDVANALLNEKGPLKQELWKEAVRVFGKDGASALVQYVGFYAYTSIMLNGFDVPVPED